jgi:hypothetical protein
MNFFLPQRVVEVSVANRNGALGKERKNQTTTTNNQTKSTKFISGLDQSWGYLGLFGAGFREKKLGAACGVKCNQMQRK